MSFIEKLGKGFVRSAVNQVGRDTGRQVSGAVFNTAKSKTGETVDISELTPVKAYTFWEVLGVIFVSVFLPFLGGIICVIVGLDYIGRKHDHYYRIEKKEVYVPDKRFKTGQRLEGHKNVKVIFKSQTTDSSKRTGYVVKGIVYLLIGSVATVYYGYIFYVFFIQTR